MRFPFIEPKALANRLSITPLMVAHGYMRFVFEFWHFNKRDADDRVIADNLAPARYSLVNWTRRRRCRSSRPPEGVAKSAEQEIAAALERAQRR